METGTNLKEIKELLFAETNFIKEFGYDRIVEHEDSFHYTLSYLSLKNEKAVEFEIDLREPACFALITQLEHSKLPEGYYMNNGKRVRIHIEKYLEDKKINPEILNGIIEMRQNNKDESIDTIGLQIRTYADLLREYISLLES
jgi:hypothetical protein